MARVLVFDVIGKEGFYEIEANELDDFYKHLKCDCFDIAQRKVGDRVFDIFVDDVGLFVEKPIPSAISSEFKCMLVGNLIFANHDMQGNTTSLSDEDIEYIKDKMMFVFNETGHAWSVIYPVDYA